MKTLCYSVRLESLVSISDKAFIARSFNGAEDVIPKSQVFGPDLTVSKSEAWWISAWILEKKSIQYSKKKSTYFTKEGRNIGRVEFSHHTPAKLDPSEITHDPTLDK